MLGEMKMMKIKLGFMLATTIAVNVLAAELPSYELRDWLNHEWRNELVTYAVTPEVAAKLKEGAQLRDSEGQEVAWQLEPDSGRLHFIASVAPLGKSVYKFAAGKPMVVSDLKVGEGAQYIELANGKTAVRVNRVLSDGEGPVAGWRLASGGWSGGSAFTAALPVESYKVSVEARGPVVARVKARTVFEGGGEWCVTVELQSGEPLFKIHEEFNCVPSAGEFALTFHEGFVPSWLMYRAAGAYVLHGKNTRLGMVVAQRVAAAKADLFLLEPWVHWQYSLNRGTWFTMLDREEGDAVFVGTGDSPCWVNPALPQAERAASESMLRRLDDGSIRLPLAIKRGEREYFVGTLSATALLEDIHGKPLVKEGDNSDDLMAGIGVSEAEQGIQKAIKANANLLQGVAEDRLFRAPLPHQYLMKHSDYPLNKIKEMVLQWEDKVTGRLHPRMLVTKEQLETFRANSEYGEGELKALRRLPVSLHVLDRVIPPYLATLDRELEQRLVDAAVRMLQEDVDSFIEFRADNSSLGVAPHHRRLVALVNLIDTILSADSLTEQQRLVLRAQLAFFGYIYHSPAYWSPERGYGAMFVNMHTTVASIQCAVAAMLPDHPECAAWFGKGMDYMRKRQVDTWVDADGNWSGHNVEAPHYALVYESPLAAMLRAERLGLADDIYKPAMKLMGEWFAKISTPPDPRFMGLRHLPPIGNTYKFEPSGIFGTLAGIYSGSDPKLAAEMQWMHEQQGNQPSPGVGGFFGDLAGYRPLIASLHQEKRQPDYKSEWFRDAGAVLRSSYGTPDETMLYMIAGKGATPNRHYDKDQGAITIWNRGVCVADDFGYTGCAPLEDQSLLVSAAASGIMEVERLEVGEEFDYLQGRQGGWLRQVLLIKQTVERPAVPEYFVIRDTLDKAAKATWYLWLAAEPVEVSGAKIYLVDENKTDDPLMGAGALDQLLDAGAPTLAGSGSLGGAGEFSLRFGDGKVEVKGAAERQSDIWFVQQPPKTIIKTEEKTRAPAGVDGTGRYLGKNPGTQVGVILESDKFDTLLTVVFTRLKSEARPAVTAMPDGTGFIINYGKGSDTVRLTSDGEVSVVRR